MNRFAQTFVAMIPFLTASIQPGETRPERHSLKGTWEVVSAFVNGKDKELKEGSIWAFSDAHLSTSFDSRSGYVIDPSKKPSWLDLHHIDVDDQPKTVRGIYALEGERLTICLSIAAEDRPTKFESVEGSEHNLIMLKRISKNVKEWPNPKKTFGEREEPAFIKFGEQKAEVMVQDARDPATQMRVLTLRGRAIDFVSALAFSPDGKILASGNVKKALMLWEASSGKPIASLRGHAKDISSLAFRRDGTILASASLDTTIDLWDISAAKHITTIYPSGPSIHAVDFNPDGSLLASAGSGGSIKLWEIPSGKEKAEFITRKKISSLAFSPDGKVLVAGTDDNFIQFWDVPSGRRLDNLQAHSDIVSSVAISSDGKRLATCSKDKTIRLWNFKTRKRIATWRGHTDWVSSIAFSPDGKTLASSGFDQSVRLWDVDSGKNTATLLGHQDFVRVVAFSPAGGTLASGGWDFQIKIWQLP
jgi:uncharacterized protein (TIGR03067 family)